MKFKYIILFLGFLLVAKPLLAADITFTASASRTRVAVGEVFEVSFAVNGSIQRFGPPAFEGFQVVGGPNQSSSMTSVNGVTTVSMSLGYDLVAAREGVYTIPAAVAVVDGKQYRSNAIRITVVKGPPAGQGGNRAGAADLSASNTDPSFDIKKRLFIRAVSDKTSVYQGEQLAVTYKLYTNIDIVDNALDKLPDFNGFWSQEIKINTQSIDWTTEIFNGARYNVATLKKVLLFPERFGKLALDPLAMTFVVRQQVPSNDPMEQFFGGAVKDVKYKIKSLPISINVKQLPEAGKPEGFQGAVGNFAIASSIDKSALKANEALNYKLKVTGSGNFKLLKTPELTVATDIEKYDPKIADQLTQTLEGVSGNREYTYLLIPRHEGTYQLAPFQFSYFNPATRKYVVLNTAAYDLKVAKGDPGTNVTAFANGGQQDVAELEKDIRYIKTSPSDLAMSGNGFYGSVLFFFSLIAGPIAFLLALGYRTWSRDHNKDAVAVKGRKASKIAARHMANAQKQLTSGDTKIFFEAVYKGLYGYLADKLNISAADLSKEIIGDALRKRSVDAAVIKDVDETIDLCEMARYAPMSGVSQPEVLERAKRIIKDIENAQT
ncbi:MAG: BatD family protein [Pedobacter sp.]